MAKTLLRSVSKRTWVRAGSCFPGERAAAGGSLRGTYCLMNGLHHPNAHRCGVRGEPGWLFTVPGQRQQQGRAEEPTVYSELSRETEAVGYTQGPLRGLLWELVAPGYGGRAVPPSAISKPEAQESLWYDSIPVQRPENLGANTSQEM